MSRGRSIFLIFQLCCLAVFLVCSSIRLAILLSANSFMFTRPMTPLWFVVGSWELGVLVV